MVEQSSHHPKVKGSSPAIAADTGRKKKCEKVKLVRFPEFGSSVLSSKMRHLFVEKTACFSSFPSEL